MNPIIQIEETEEDVEIEAVAGIDVAEEIDEKETEENGLIEETKGIVETEENDLTDVQVELEKNVRWRQIVKKDVRVFNVQNPILAHQKEDSLLQVQKDFLSI